MKTKNKLYDEILDKYSFNELENLVKNKKNNVNKMKLNISKKILLNQKLDLELNS